MAVPMPAAPAAYALTLDALSICRWEDDGGAGPAVSSRGPGPVVVARGRGAGRCATRIASGLNRKAAPLAKPVYPTLADHQIHESDWEYADLSAMLHEWYGRFNDRFRLGLPVAPLRLDPDLRGNCGGCFRPGHNEFGLVYEIAVRAPGPGDRSDLDIGGILGTLLHEQLHLLQELTGIAGRNNYHNAQYRATAERFGLVVDHRGHQGYDPDSPFLDLLAEYGVPAPRPVMLARAAALRGVPLPLAPISKRPGRSKLAKWSCGCTNVRVGVAVFHARCTRPDCGQPFFRC